MASSHARLFKVLGDLFLLAGRPEDALVWYALPFISYLGHRFLAENRYTEALLLFKSSPDSAWHAATLEGIATVFIIEAWSVGNGLVRRLI